MVPKAPFFFIFCVSDALQSLALHGVSGISSVSYSCHILCHIMREKGLFFVILGYFV